MPTGVYERRRKGSVVVCEVCGGEFYRLPSRTSRFCSRKCVPAARRGKPQPWAVPPPPKIGAESPHWKGDDVSYSGLHHWVRKTLGKPDRCAHCGEKKGKRFEWANISGKYLRDTSDWMPLCGACHYKYDRRPERINSIKEELS
jgi:hypothetical protein